MAEESSAAEHTGHAAGGFLKGIMAAHLGPLPLPVVIIGGIGAVIAGYLYYKNKGPAGSVAQPVAVPVSSGGGSSGGVGGGGSGSSGADSTAALDALAGSLGQLQTNLAALGTETSAIQAQQATQGNQLTQLAAQQQAAQPTPAPAPAAPTPAPTPSGFSSWGYTPSVSSNPYAQASNLASAASSNAAAAAYQQQYDQMFLSGQSGGSSVPFSSYQTPYFNPTPAQYTYNAGYSIPSYQPLPQYGAQSHPYVGPTEAGTYVAGNYQPSSVFGSGANAYTVQGYYVTNPDGSKTWVT